MHTSMHSYDTARLPVLVNYFHLSVLSRATAGPSKPGEQTLKTPLWVALRVFTLQKEGQGKSWSLFYSNCHFQMILLSILAQACTWAGRGPPHMCVARRSAGLIWQNMIAHLIGISQVWEDLRRGRGVNVFLRDTCLALLACELKCRAGQLCCLQ